MQKCNFYFIFHTGYHTMCIFIIIEMIVCFMLPYNIIIIYKWLHYLQIGDKKCVTKWNVPTH